MPNTHFQGFNFRPVELPKNCPYKALGLALGQGSSALEVLVATAEREPSLADVRSLWKARRGGRAAPLVVAVLHNGRAALCGPTGEDPPVYPDADIGQAERICREALEQPNRHAAIQSLETSLKFCDAREHPLSGITNNGLLAMHELARGVHAPHWAQDWARADQKSRPLLGERGDALLRSLGFQIVRIDQATSLLRAGADGKRIAVAVLLHHSESPELQADRFGGLSPVSYALAVADRENLPYVVVSQGPKLRLYPVKMGVGVGQRGRSETYVEVHTGLLRDGDAAYLWLLFSSEALIEGGSLDRLLKESKDFAGSLAEQLRERIYGAAIPRLAEALAAARGLRKPTARDLADTYEMAMTVLFRLLFIAYAEDKDLLPYRHNESYRDRSLKRRAQELARMQRETVAFDDSDSLWQEISLLFSAIEKGKGEWGVPEYDGGLFASDADGSHVGHLLTAVTLSNRDFGPALREILTIEVPGEGRGPVDFRSLGVREFGTIYEGLLESELSVAETDLTYDETGKEKGVYRPCKKGEEPKVTRRRIYLHDKSGARKSTGTYFTKKFAVEHLLKNALEPALREHFERLDKLDDDDAAERFFDFRVADIAMGSGHFLVAAVDHIEQGFTQYLSKRPLSGVRAELAKLRSSAADALGPLAEQVQIEDTQLLRRLIARRCIYGVDLNPVAVTLARVSIWIHTFVPGLPLSLLDHNLTCGNSLVGIGQLSELHEIVTAEDARRQRAGRIHQHAMFTVDAARLLGPALEPLRRLQRIADTTAAEVKLARNAMKEARNAVAPAEALCDIAAACRMAGEVLPIDLDQWEKVKETIVDSRHHKEAKKTLADLSPLHFPIAFPEVFLRERSGFDLIVGNPPWQEATLEEHAFWARHFPGLRSMNQRDQERMKARLRHDRADLGVLYEKELAEAGALRRALTTGPYPGMGTGDPDLYKAFCWRFVNLVSAESGWIGVVLPRSAFNAKGTAEFRVAAFNSAEPVDITTLVNNRQWVFPEVHPQYSIALVAIRRAEAGKHIQLRGPFASLDRFSNGIHRPPSVFTTQEVLSWTDTASLPLLPTEESLDVFARLRAAPRLDTDDGENWRARPHRELDASNDKKLMDVESESRPRGFWPVFKGESFDLWEPDRGAGTYYAWADPKKVVPHLHQKALRGTLLKSSAFSEFDARRFSNRESLPCYAPRIAFRDVTNRTNQRTVIAALVPPKVFIANQAPYLLWPRGNEQDAAFLLAVLSSLPLDWYARRFVETHVNFYIFAPFPIPRPSRGDLLWLRAVQLAGRLAAVDDRYADWAAAVGVECGPVDAKLKFDMICELDAVVALLYGLDEKHLRHIFETFHEGWGPGQTATHPTLGEYDVRLKTTLADYRAWTKKAYPTAYQSLKPLIEMAREIQAEDADAGDAPKRSRLR